jgi:hypothetical protein
MAITKQNMVLLRIHILRNIPITMTTEVAMTKIQFVIEVVDTVIRQLIQEKLRMNESEMS